MADGATSPDAATYRDFFLGATGRLPHPYQVRLGTTATLPSVLAAPTGAGKTHAILVAWLYRRLAASPAVRDATPLRLVYALPMRALVEQVWEALTEVLDRLGLDEGQLGRHMVMGGSVDKDWVRLPERPAVLVGSVDMLLSRALNRGYASGRSRWPMDFGLLNADCLWVFDETQLMATAAMTAAQLQGLRERLGTWRACHTVWMSATMDASLLATPDHPRTGVELRLQDDDLGDDLHRRLHAPKTLRFVTNRAAAPFQDHLPGTLTLAVHNTVRRAADSYRRLRRRPLPGDPELLLIHSRFRPPDRRRLVARLRAPLPAGGRVVCATQVVEAGVDVSARLLVTEVAPWSSMVQRLGRCNRYGELSAGAVRWLDVTSSDPYPREDVQAARELLTRLEGSDVSAWALAHLEAPPSTDPPRHVLRRRDLLDLFDTAPDLSGSDLDVSRFIREGDELDCAVFWRRWRGERPDATVVDAVSDELCPVPVGELRKLVDGGRPAWCWDPVDARWRRLSGRDLRPGMTVLLSAESGGYSAEAGWDPHSGQPVEPVAEVGDAEPDANWADPLSRSSHWVALERHVLDVRRHAALIADAALPLLPGEVKEALSQAALWHDAGKALPRFQEMLLAGTDDDAERERRRGTLWAKSARLVPPAVRNPRHELASALALLQAGLLVDRLGQPWADLCLYLVAAHHGKARLTIRPWPQDEPGRQILGVQEGDMLPQIRLDGHLLPPLELRLDPLRMGDTQSGPSWSARMLALRDGPDLGPFRLGQLEAALRAADWRASAEEAEGV